MKPITLAEFAALDCKPGSRKHIKEQLSASAKKRWPQITFHL
jgi:hypothetical protein